MKGLFWLLALFALAVGLSMAMRFNDAYVLIVLPPWRAEVSLNLALAVLFGGFVLLYGALRGIALTLSLPGRVRAYRETQRKAKAASVFQDAVRLLFEGRFGHALKKAAEAHSAGEAPGLAALIAARAAQRMRESGKQEAWLDRATQDDARTEVARLMLEAEMYLDARRFDDAVTVLSRLHQLAGRHIAALRLELRAQQGAGHWNEVLRIARQLEKRDALAFEAFREVTLRAHCENVTQHAGDLGLLLAYLREVPEREMGAKLVCEAADLLIAQGSHEAARRLIEDQLAREWDSELVIRFGRTEGDVSGRIAKAEAWLTAHPRDAALLVVLGRLCILQQLWGKAQSYLDAALSIEDSCDTRLVLAGLAERLERQDEANRHYRAAAQLSVAR
ncbi:MAG TPA: heme biosynthesis HemY N-terminal domain-containing protein [Azospira sp.]|nr:heme biosynthesis HemY N-terminal domain-containing protein [Azospira sp.]